MRENKLRGGYILCRSYREIIFCNLSAFQLSAGGNVAQAITSTMTELILPETLCVWLPVTNVTSMMRIMAAVIQTDTLKRRNDLFHRSAGLGQAAL